MSDPHRAGTRSAVELRGATVAIDGRTVLGPIDLDVAPGERWVLLGPNGSGKTTLLALAGARRQPSAGEVVVLGGVLGRVDIRAIHPRVSHTSHILAERIPPGLTVHTVVLTGTRGVLSPWFHRLRRGGPRSRERHSSSRSDAPISPTADPSRAARASGSGCSSPARSSPNRTCCSWTNPPSGLDLPAREALIDALEMALTASAALTTILATHHLEEIPPSSTHAALLRAGRLVVGGAIGDVLTPSALETCFGIAMDVGRRNGRWWATAR